MPDMVRRQAFSIDQAREVLEQHEEQLDVVVRYAGLKFVCEMLLRYIDGEEPQLLYNDAVAALRAIGWTEEPDA